MTDWFKALNTLKAYWHIFIYSLLIQKSFPFLVRGRQRIFLLMDRRRMVALILIVGMLIGFTTLGLHEGLVAMIGTKDLAWWKDQQLGIQFTSSLRLLCQQCR
jgi:hypothetical protein